MYKNIKYGVLFGTGRLNIPQKELETVESFETLLTRTLEALKTNDLKTANISAKKASLNYGALGLILYYKVQFQILKHIKKNKNEIIEVKSSQLLAYLKLANKLVALEKNSEAVKKYFPEYCTNQSINWKKLEDDLLQLAEIDGTGVDEPEKVAKHIYQQHLKWLSP